ncbi:MAG: hypothetical protein U0L10_08455 [Lachnospiraceae bacterium]|jgi:hypothetical protein|nr:hypothetical protein [Lachnospiraceae bacterium]
MTSTKKQNRNRLLYWKKIILTAESHTGTRIEWMRQHGIRESSYYYWHKILLNNGMLDDKDTSHLEGIELPPAIGQHELETQTGFVEYHASGPQICMCANQLETHRYPAQIMIEKNGYQVHVAEGFSPVMLSQVLEVVAHAE